MASIQIDPSDRTHLPLCRECGWRGEPEPSRIAALTSGARHERRAHPDDDQARAALDQATRRARRRASKT